MTEAFYFKNWCLDEVNFVLNPDSDVEVNIFI